MDDVYFLLVLAPAHPGWPRERVGSSRHISTKQAIQCHSR